MHHSIIFFRVKAQTQLSQQVKVCGNLPELGNWNPSLALSLQTDDQIYPMWLNQMQISVGRGVEFQFKLIITDGERIFWESIPNRCLTLQSQKQFLWCSFNIQEIRLFPVPSSDGSLSLQQDDLGITQFKTITDKVKKYHISNSAEPFDSEFDSSSDLDSLYPRTPRGVFSTRSLTDEERLPQGNFGDQLTRIKFDWETQDDVSSPARPLKQ